MFIGDVCGGFCLTLVGRFLYPNKQKFHGKTYDPQLEASHVKCLRSLSGTRNTSNKYLFDHCYCLIIVYWPQFKGEWCHFKYVGN